MNAALGCVVEGHGEVVALPVLIRRIGESLDPPIAVQIPPPVRTPKSRLVKPDELERAVRLAVGKAGPNSGVLVLIDADEDCPAILGPALLARAEQAGKRPAAVVIAKGEYENWFLAAARSVAGARGLQPALVPPPDAEAIRGAKEWLGDRMQGSRRYSEVLDQPALSALFSLQEARNARSFDKFFRDVVRVLLATGQP